MMFLPLGSIISAKNLRVVELDISVKKSILEVVNKRSSQKVDVSSIEKCLWHLPNREIAIYKTFKNDRCQLRVTLDVNESEEKEAIVLVHLIQLVSMFDVFKRLSHVKFKQGDAPKPSALFEVFHWQEVEDDRIDCCVPKACID